LDEEPARKVLSTCIPAVTGKAFAAKWRILLISKWGDLMVFESGRGCGGTVACGSGSCGMLPEQVQVSVKALCK